MLNIPMKGLFQAYALSPAAPGYGATAGPGTSPTQAAGEPFAADSPYFPFSARPAPRLSPAKGVKGHIRQAKEEPQLDQQWVVSNINFETPLEKFINVSKRNSQKAIKRDKVVSNYILEYLKIIQTILI